MPLPAGCSPATSGGLEIRPRHLLCDWPVAVTVTGGPSPAVGGGVCGDLLFPDLLVEASRVCSSVECVEGRGCSLWRPPCFSGFAFWGISSPDLLGLVALWAASSRLEVFCSDGLRARGCSSSSLLACLLLAVAIAVRFSTMSPRQVGFPSLPVGGVCQRGLFSWWRTMMLLLAWLPALMVGQPSVLVFFPLPDVGVRSRLMFVSLPLFSLRDSSSCRCRCCRLVFLPSCLMVVSLLRGCISAVVVDDEASGFVLALCSIRFLPNVRALCQLEFRFFVEVISSCFVFPSPHRCLVATPHA
ncbi:hypothetical protein Dimus_010710 [Dionaea muscipula]